MRFKYCPTRARLEYLHHTLGLSTGRLAERFGVSPSVIRNWLDGAGIPRLPRGRQTRYPPAPFRPAPRARK